jgi:hypothetical protein
MTENAPAAGWEEHDHEGLVHTHRHFHVTHNHNEMTGGFEHSAPPTSTSTTTRRCTTRTCRTRTSTASMPARRTSTTTTSRPRRDSGPEHLPDLGVEEHRNSG